MNVTYITDFHNLDYPLLAAPKIDGVHCRILNGVPLIEEGPVPNMVIHQVLSGLPSMEGMLTVGSPVGDVYERTHEAVYDPAMVPEFKFWVFDVVLRSRAPFNQRYDLAKSWANASGKCVQPVIHKLCKTAEAVDDYEAQMLLTGFKQIVLRDLDAPYSELMVLYDEKA